VADVLSDPEPIPPVLTEIQGGGGLSLSAAGRLFPGHRGGNSVDPSTVFRWVTKGARAADGLVVRLEAVRVGSRWLTSRYAVARFVTALTAATGADAAPPSRQPRTAPAEQRAAAAIAKLKSLGA
jgi:hypothetical protein